METKNIVVNLSNFTLEQDVYCYIDGDCTEKRKVSIDDIVLTVEQLKKKYQVGHINLVGVRDYVEKIRDEMANKNTFSTCVIDIITR